MPHLPNVSVIVPVKPGGEVKALERLRVVDYPVERLEVLVAEGRCPSRQRNLAASGAAGEILYFLDDDSMVSPGFLRRAARHFVNSDVAAVGGPSLTPPTDTRFQRAVGIALASLFGGGGARNRYRKDGSARATDERELILCNLAFRKSVFLGMGGLDERLYPNEENELMDRIVAAEHLLVHDPELAVLRSQRPTLKAVFRQFFGYGRGRGEQTRIGGVRSLVDFLPSLFLLYLGSAILAGDSAYFLPALCYVAAVLTFSSVNAWQSGEPGAFWPMTAVYPAMHFSYGAGVLAGLIIPRINRCRDAGGVAVRTVKRMGAPWDSGAGGG